MSALDKVLPLLEGVRKRSATTWIAKCPAHDDRTASLSISEDPKGIGLHCFAGCSTEEIVARMGLTMKDLFHVQYQSRPRRPRSRDPLTLAALAQHFRLEPRFLAENGVKETESGVLIAYLDLEGRPLARTRIRQALHGKNRFKWDRGNADVIPYGLQFVPKWRERGPEPFLILVEGESDAWAGWSHSLPVLGIPGVGMTKYLQREHVEGFRKLYVLREPDQGGDMFLWLISKRLAKLGWSGELFAFGLGAIKDLADLHRDEPSRFTARLEEALRMARPLQVPVVDSGLRKRKGSQRKAAMTLLREVLGGGASVPVKEIQRLAKEREISWATIRRVADPNTLAIDKRPAGFGLEWVWSMVPKPSSTDHDHLQAV